jgi:hypothetical protein
MRIKKSWLSTVPILFLSAACGDARTPTGLTPQAARFEVVGTATVASDCQVQIDALVEQTKSAPITTRNPERDLSGLVKILSDAKALLDVGKNSDAAVKLANYITKVEQLAAGGKLDAASADQLIAGANDSIACINMIGA